MDIITFIIACAAGAFLNLAHIGLPGPLYDVLDILGGGALGLGLLTVGAGLNIHLVLKNRVLVGFGALIRLLGMPGLMRCQPWRAKRRLVDPSSSEAALFSRRALRQRENKVDLRTRRPVIWEPSTEQQRACEVVA